MYTATIIYEFKKGQFEKGLAIWKKIVLSAAQGQKGLMRMQLLEGPGKFMAQGTLAGGRIRPSLYAYRSFQSIDGGAAAAIGPGASSRAMGSH
jgi:hypothetical protein